MPCARQLGLQVGAWSFLPLTGVAAGAGAGAGCRAAHASAGCGVISRIRCPGPPGWLQVLRSEGYDERADVYSYGVVLWECLTGQQPWAGMHAMQVRRPGGQASCAGCGGAPAAARLLWLHRPARRPRPQRAAAAAEHA